MTNDIIIVQLPFLDNHKSKPRPVLQLTEPSDEHNNFQVAYISSIKPATSYKSDIAIENSISNQEITGLTKNSYIRCSKIFTIDPTLVKYIIGQLPQKQKYELQITLKNHFNL
jgi:subtilase family serine protease